MIADNYNQKLQRENKVESRTKVEIKSKHLWTKNMKL